MRDKSEQKRFVDAETVLGNPAASFPDIPAQVEASALLSTIISSSDDAIISEDLSGNVMSWNKAAKHLFGYSADEMVGKPVRTIFPPERKDEEAMLLERIRKGETVTRFETVRLKKDGSLIDISLTVSPIKDGSGKIIGAAKIARNLAEHKKAEETFRSEQRLRLILEGAPNGMVMVDEHGVIIMVNAQMERLFGYERTEMIGQSIEMLLPERYRGAHVGQREDFFRSPLTRAMGHGRDLFARRKDGTEFPVEVGLNPAKTPTGTVVLAAVIDITQRKTMEAELAKAHAELSHHARDLEAIVAERTAHLQSTIAELEGVSYSLSHDMRAPLRTIQSFSQIVLEEAGEKLNDEERDLLQKVISAAGRLDRLIQDVLIYSKVARESIELNSIDVEQLLRQIIHERHDLQPPKAEIEISGPLAKVLGHEAYLTQCITNLLDNAVKFVPSDRQPRIRIRNEMFDGKVRLWFEDNGIGIAQEAQERIFGMFQRVHGERAYPGTGIGLTIVRKAVERMGGRAGVESALNQGSRFWLELSRGDTP